MKKFFVLVFFLIIGSICYGQPDEFFGMRFGKEYSLEEMKTAVGENGTYEDYSSFDYAENIVLDTYLFSNVTYGDSFFPAMVLEFSAKTSHFVGVSFCIFQDEDHTPEAMEQAYNSMVDSLKTKYSMSYFPVEDSTVTRLTSIGITCGVHLDKTVVNGVITTIELMYVTPLELALEVLNDPSERPEIQDTFWGMKFGEKYSSTAVKAKLITRGTFLSQDRDGASIFYEFKDASFAGKNWNYANLYFTPDNRFFMLFVYESMNNTIRDKRSATANFNSLKAKLDDKYGFVETEQDEDDSMSVTYIGKNDISILLTLKESRASSGDYRIFLTLTYAQTELLRETNKISDDEL